VEKHQQLHQLSLFLMVIVYDVQQDDQQYVHVVYIEQIILKLERKTDYFYENIFFYNEPDLNIC